MFKGRSGRFLSILAAILLLAALSLSLAYIVLRRSYSPKIDEALLAAELAVREEDRGTARRELLRGSRYAVSANHWSRLLFLATQLLPEAPRPRDYRLFTAIAGRASAALPGNQDFLAYFTWGRLRRGEAGKAHRHAQSLTGLKWSSLRAETRLAALLDDYPDGVRDLLSSLDVGFDADALEEAADLTESAELTADAALAHMLDGHSSRALEAARNVMAGTRRWSNPAMLHSRGIIGAMGRIAYDAGDAALAAQWLEEGLAEARVRRAAAWEDLHFLGFIYWEMFQSTGREDYLEKTAGLWYEAISLVSASEGSPPDASWKLMLNLAALEASSGSLRRSEELLQEALQYFPDRGEVKAAWGRFHADDDPAMARRITTGGGEGAADAVLGIAAIQINPEAVSPRLYEAALWELFQLAADNPDEVSEADARIIAVFLLEYMASRRNYSSVDVAVDRYLKVYPGEAWILGWRLAADASRRLAIINLISAEPGGESPYAAFRRRVRNSESWRGLYDSALYASLAAEEVMGVADAVYGPAVPGDLEYRDALLLSGVIEAGRSYRLADQPLGDRIDGLERGRTDLENRRKSLLARGRRGRRARAAAKGALYVEAHSLHSNALEDLRLAAAKAVDMDPDQRADFLYLEAHLHRLMGNDDQAAIKAAEAIAENPFHSRAGELLNSGAFQ